MRRWLANVLHLGLKEISSLAADRVLLVFIAYSFTVMVYTEAKGIRTEVENAKKYLTGSFALRFDTNAKIANQLLWIMREEMGIDYVDKRNAQVEAVTLGDLKRVAKRLLKTDDLIVTVVGKPKGLAPRG